jgi:hypothetical protein
MGNTTISLDNHGKPAPKWFRKFKKAIMVLTVAANVMIGSWGLKDPLLVARLQLWCTVGIIAILEALEALLANGEDYVSNQSNQP